MSAPPHSPLPWVLHYDGREKVANVNTESCPDAASAPAFRVMPAESNAELIVRAVNGHAGLVARVAELERALSAILTDSDPRYGAEAPRMAQLLASCHEIARSALAKGGGR